MEAFMHNQVGKPLDTYVNSICNQFQVNKFPPNLKKRKGDALFDHHLQNSLQKSHSFSTNDPMGKSFANMNPDSMKFYTNQEVSAIENDLNKNRYMVVLANQLSNSNANFSNAYSNIIMRNNIANAFVQQPQSVNLTNNVNISNTNNATTSKVNSTKPSVTDGDYQIVVGENLNSLSDSYEVLSFLGRGTFGQVVKCVSKTEKKLFAIKILKNHPSYLRQGNVEIQILQALSRQDTEAHNIVRAIECFQHKQHMCLVFELLEQNLYEYLKANRFKPLSLREIRPITQQVLVALTQLKNLGLIHADLKPENIMLVNPSSNSYLKYKVKVIDFGSACYSSKTVQNTYLQSRYYRAPEILLGLPFNESIDMWSLGCVIAELFLGWPLYPGSSEFDQIRYIVETQGLPPSDMIMNAGKGNRFFIKYSDMNNVAWRLKTHDEYFTDNGHPTKEARKYIFSCLDQIREIGLTAQPGTSDYEIEIEDRKKFSNLLSSMLQVRPTDRIQPESALMHPFVTLEHYQAFPYTKKIHESVVLMQVCYRNKNGVGKNRPIQINPIQGGFLHPAPTPQEQHPFIFMNYPVVNVPPKANNNMVMPNQVPSNMPQQRYTGLDMNMRKNDVSAAALSSFYDLISAANCNNTTAISLLLAAASKENYSNSAKIKKEDIDSYHHQQQLANNLLNQRNSANYFSNSVNSYYESQTIPQSVSETAALIYQQQQQQQRQTMSNYTHISEESMHFNNNPINSSKINSHTMQSSRQSIKSHQSSSEMQNNNRFHGNNVAFVQGILAAALAQQKSHPQQQQQQMLNQQQNAQFFQHLFQQQQQTPSLHHHHPSQVPLQNQHHHQHHTASTNNIYYPSPNAGNPTNVHHQPSQSANILPNGNNAATSGLVGRNLKPCVVGSNANYSFFDVQHSLAHNTNSNSSVILDSFHDHNASTTTDGGNKLFNSSLDYNNQLCDHEASIMSTSASNLHHQVHPRLHHAHHLRPPSNSPGDHKSVQSINTLQNMLLISNGSYPHSQQTTSQQTSHQPRRGSRTFNNQFMNESSPNIQRTPQIYPSSLPPGRSGYHGQKGSMNHSNMGDYFDTNSLDLQKLLEYQLKYSSYHHGKADANACDFNNRDLMHLLKQEAINQTRSQLKQLYPNLNQTNQIQQAIAAQLLFDQKIQNKGNKGFYESHHQHHPSQQQQQTGYLNQSTNTTNSNPMQRRSSKKSKDDSHQLMMQRMMWSMLENSWQQQSSISSAHSSLSTMGQPQKRPNMEDDDEDYDEGYHNSSTSLQMPKAKPMRIEKKTNETKAGNFEKSNSSGNIKAAKDYETTKTNWVSMDENTFSNESGIALSTETSVKTQSGSSISKIVEDKQKLMTMTRPGNDKPITADPDNTIPVGRVQPMPKDQDVSGLIFAPSTHPGLQVPNSEKTPNPEDIEAQNLLTNYVLIQLRNQGSVDLSEHSVDGLSPNGRIIPANEPTNLSSIESADSQLIIPDTNTMPPPPPTNKNRFSNSQASPSTPNHQQSQPSHFPIGAETDQDFLQSHLL